MQSLKDMSSVMLSSDIVMWCYRWVGGELVSVTYCEGMRKRRVAGGREDVREGDRGVRGSARGSK